MLILGFPKLDMVFLSIDNPCFDNYTINYTWVIPGLFNSMDYPPNSYHELIYG